MRERAADLPLLPMVQPVAAQDLGIARRGNLARELFHLDEVRHEMGRNLVELQEAMQSEDTRIGPSCLDQRKRRHRHRMAALDEPLRDLLERQAQRTTARAKQIGHRTGWSRGGTSHARKGTVVFSQLQKSLAEGNAVRVLLVLVQREPSLRDRLSPAGPYRAARTVFGESLRTSRAEAAPRVLHRRRGRRGPS